MVTTLPPAFMEFLSSAESPNTFVLSNGLSSISEILPSLIFISPKTGSTVSLVILQIQDALDDYIEVAKRILSEAPLDDGIEQTLSTQAEELRWFPTPTEAGK